MSNYLFQGGEPIEEEEQDYMSGGYYVDSDNQIINPENFQGQLYGGYNKVGKGEEDREGYDSFTIYESSTDYSGSRFISKTPFGAAGKAATRIFNEAGPRTDYVNFVLRKTTLNSDHKYYAYDAELELLNPPLKITLKGPNGPVVKIVKKKMHVKKAELPKKIVDIYCEYIGKRDKLSPSAIESLKNKKEAARKRAAAKKAEADDESPVARKPAAKKPAAKKPAAKKPAAKKSSNSEDAEIARIEKENKKIEAELKKARTQIKKTMENVAKKQEKTAKAKEELKALKAENRALNKAPKAAKAPKEAKAPKAKAPKAEGKAPKAKAAKKGGNGSCGMYY